MESKVSKFSCDSCGKELSTSRNSMDIVSSKSEGTWWSRIHVQILHKHGVHNDGKTDKADLCQQCAIDILADALARVKSGERATAGTESSDPQGWNGKSLSYGKSDGK